jgi:hypothetical protein
MIVFINGPFGVGKTTVAKLLVRRMPHAMLYDPEIIGGVLNRTLQPFTKVEDFQDYTLWRRLVVGGARLSRTLSGRPLVVPMTIWKRHVFDYLVAGLLGADPDLSCFRLTVSREVLVSRISSDSEDREAYPWRTSHLDFSLKASQGPAFGREIPTEDRTPTEVADQILEYLPLHAGWSASR